MRRLLLVALALAACNRAPSGSAIAATSSDTVLRAPDGSTPPAGALGQSILRGRAILLATRDSLAVARR